MADSTHKTTLKASTRPAGLVVMRSGGGREQGAYRQARAFSVDADGTARLLSLTHTKGAGSYTPRFKGFFGKAVAA